MVVLFLVLADKVRCDELEALSTPYDLVWIDPNRDHADVLNEGLKAKGRHLALVHLEDGDGDLQYPRNPLDEEDVPNLHGQFRRETIREPINPKKTKFVKKCL